MSHRAIRAIHGMLALMLATLLALYVLSGWMIIHGVRFGSSESRTTSVPVEAVGGASEDPKRVRAVARSAASAAGVTSARMTAPQFVDGVWRVKLTRAAHSARVTLTPGATEARVRLREAPIAEGMKRLHRARANTTQAGRLAWMIARDVLAIALLAFSVTGVLLFRNLKRDRRLGWALLGASSLYTLGGIAWLVLAP
jgi:hypothetical protein